MPCFGLVNPTFSYNVKQGFSTSAREGTPPISYLESSFLTAHGLVKGNEDPGYEGGTPPSQKSTHAQYATGSKKAPRRRCRCRIVRSLMAGYGGHFKSTFYRWSGTSLQLRALERGTEKQRTKLKKICLKRKRTIATRKNRAYADLTSMPLLCSCNQGCLMRPGTIEARQIMIRQQRNKLFLKSYIEQNYILSKLMEVRLCPSGLRPENKVPHPRLGTSLQGRLRKMLRTVRRQNQGSVKKNGRRWFIDGG